MERYLTTFCLLMMLLAGSAYAEVRLVAAGQPAAVVVTAEEPTPVAAYAAEELVYHLERATGARLQVVTASEIPAAPATRIHVGGYKAPNAEPFVDALPGEGCVLRTVGNVLYIVGEDGDGDPLAMDTHAGTLWGVYELLERVLGVRWLWPGELGCYVPQTDTVVIPDTDEVIEPRLLQRNLRSGLGLRGASGFTPEGKQQYAHDQTVFLRRHRMGRVVRLRYGHAFNAWWDRYGAEHPEWFQLLENGRRGPSSPGARFSMCVSDPGFHNQMVALWLEARAQSPGEFININCCENDIRGLCTCENCLAWDGPQPEEVLPRFGPRVVSDRYARFYLAVQQLAAQHDPEATVVGYAYVNYAPPPSEDIRLNEQIFVGTVPDVFFPRTEQEQQWVKDQWAGWRRAGCKLFLRPNYMLDGYCMPHVFAHQFADEFQFEARNGMVGTDFDSLTGQWAVQGTTLYLLARLHNRPDSDVDDLLEEYYAGFGAAAPHAKAYFDYWEDYTTQNRERFREIAQRRAAGWSTYARGAHEMFPPSSFEAAEKLLDRAAAAVDAPSEYAQRVEFLRKGLEHARLTAQVCETLAGDREEVSPVAWRRVTEQLMAFRREAEQHDISNLDFCDFVEGRSWAMPDVYNGEPLQAVAEAPGELAEGVFAPLRGTHTCVALLAAGESFRARLGCRRVGQNEAAVEWRLWGPDDRLLERGSVPVGEEAEIEVPARQAGVHLLLIVSSNNAARVTLLNDHAAIAGRAIKLISASSPLFFYVPEGAEQLTMTLQTPAPGETAMVRIMAPDGQEMAADATGENTEVAFEVPVPEGQDGRAWSVQVERGGPGVLEDYRLTLGEGVPGYWGHAPERLVRPAE